jgi:phosphopantothenoylcysteine synthetase/decarboxylase
MQDHVRGGCDAVVHSAAVSDYLAAGVYAPAANTVFHADRGEWHSSAATPPLLLDRAAGKVKSDEAELWLRLVRAPKLVDLVRSDWGFRGVLVKFKLEVGVSAERLLEIAERSRRHSAADLMAANTLEGAAEWAYLGPVGGAYERVARRDLAARLLEEVERLHRERTHG